MKLKKTVERLLDLRLKLRELVWAVGSYFAVRLEAEVSESAIVYRGWVVRRCGLM